MGDFSLVTCSALTKLYGSNLALSNVDLELGEGKIIGLLGPNGSGKTTLIKIIAGLLQPTSGVVSVLGNPVGVESKSMISYLPERLYFNRGMKVSECLSLFADFYEDFDLERARQMLQNLNVSENAAFRTLSKGMCEKVQLALVMSRRAKLYLLDEPIGGVDPAAREYILRTILQNQNPDSTILISTHLIQDVETILDEVIFLKQGVIIRHDTSDNIRSEYDMSIDGVFREVFKC